MDLKIEKVVVGEIGTNCYILILDNDIAVIDPGDEADKISKAIDKYRDNKCRYILLTHAHYDHILAVRELKKKYEFEIVLGDYEKDIYENVEVQSEYSGFDIPYQGKVDKYVEDGDKISFGNGDIEIIYTPGHTMGSVSYLIGDNLFSGDTLFRQFHGRTDLPTGNRDDIWDSLKKLTSMNKGVKVYPGHGEETTIGREKGYYE